MTKGVRTRRTASGTPDAGNSSRTRRCGLISPLEWLTRGVGGDDDSATTMRSNRVFIVCQYLVMLANNMCARPDTIFADHEYVLRLRRSDESSFGF